MKTYLSFGGGVNSVAMMLLMLDEGWEFEAVFVDHGCDWPETYEYLEMFQGWLKDNGHRPITVIKPQLKRGGKIWSNLYDFCIFRRVVPSRMRRWCTLHFKSEPLENYFQHPCFTCIGYAADEAHRAKIYCREGVEYRYPLIENEITRSGCVELIESHGLPLPDKSGCWFCPFQRMSEFKRLRIEQPNLWCKLLTLEETAVKRDIEGGRKPFYMKDKPMEVVVNEDQYEFWEEYKPPCYCAR